MYLSLFPHTNWTCLQGHVPRAAVLLFRGDVQFVYEDISDTGTYVCEMCDIYLCTGCVSAGQGFSDRNSFNFNVCLQIDGVKCFTCLMLYFSIHQAFQKFCNKLLALQFINFLCFLIILANNLYHNILIITGWFIVLKNGVVDCERNYLLAPLCMVV